jgi:hypothetical protein
MTGIIFETEEQIEKYKTITDQEIKDIINSLHIRSHILNCQGRHKEYSKLLEIIESLEKLRVFKFDYRRLIARSEMTVDIKKHLEEIDNKMQQIWLYYLKTKNKKKEMKI